MRAVSSTVAVVSAVPGSEPGAALSGAGSPQVIRSSDKISVIKCFIGKSRNRMKEASLSRH